MKKYSVIGNPIDHSLSPKLHNYWLKKSHIKAVYNKKRLNKKELKKFILNVLKKKINGINITVPYKKNVIPYLDKLTPEAKSTQSVNTIYLDKEVIVGHNTDINGFEFAIKHINLNLINKKVFILGAGGVVPSIIFALIRMKVSKIILSNRTKQKAEELKKLFKKLIIIDWGEVPEFDMVINATSLGLNPDDKINIDFSKVTKNKFFYDVIYNPRKTEFLKIGEKLGCKTENGKMMFIYQAQASFKVWHNIEPTINDEVIKLLDK